MKKHDYIIVNGYIWTGSSTVVDLLKEFDGCCEAGIEQRITQDPHGLGELYEELVHNWDILGSDIALKEFLIFAERLNRKAQRYRMKLGLNYEEYFKGDFMKATYDFAARLTDFDYAGSWFYLHFMKTPMELFLFKLLRKFGRMPETERMYFVKVSEDEFIDAARIYIDGIYKTLASGQEHMIVDSGPRISHYDVEMKFFRNSKMIMVDRDPRDICANMIKRRGLIGAELAQKRDMRKYVKYHRAMRETEYKIKEDPKVLQIRFEDMVRNYDESVKKISDFCGLDLSKHSRKMKYFKPALSEKNIGMYRNYLTKKESKYIEKELAEYLYI